MRASHHVLVADDSDLRCEKLSEMLVFRLDCHR